MRFRFPQWLGLSTCLLLVLPAFSQSAAPRPLITQPIMEDQLATLRGNTHPLARPQFDIGAAPPDLPMQRMLLVLKRTPQQDFALRKLLDDQQDKASPNYHKWLTPDEFGAQFGPSDQDVQQVAGWLASHGFQVNRISHGRTVIEFSGVEAQVEGAFHTQIHKYLVNGEEHWANASDPQIPAALAPAVAGVWSLHNFLKKPQVRVSQQPIGFTPKPGLQPQVTFQNPSGSPIHALGPADYATIYNINPVYQAGINGTGETIGVVGRSDLYSFGQDVSDFRNFVFPLCCGSFSVVYDGPSPGDLGGGEEAEATLDVTWAGAIAPGARVDLVVSATTNTTDGVDLSELYIIDNNLADIMTESFGSCEAAYTQPQADGMTMLAQQAAAQGITYMVSTGDNGAEGCDNPNAETVAQGPVSVNILASTAFNVAVGGTMFNENGQSSKYWGSSGPVAETALSYIPENVWNESCSTAKCGQNANISAGSGGASIFRTKPSWQSGIAGIPNDGARDIPDVSLTSASHDPYLLCLQGSCGQNFIYFVWGTSAASPSFAGMMALVDQKMGQLNPNNVTTGRQGQADYVLYRLAAGEALSQCNGSKTSSLPANNCIFNDVTVGNNVVPGETTSQYSAGVGYDLASGLGSVNVQNLVSNWNSVTFSPTTTSLAISPLTITHGSPVNVNIGVAPSNGTGIPTGDVSLIADYSFSQSAVGLFTLNSGAVSTTTNSLPGGQYFLTAHYSGDGIYAPSVSVGSSIITVNPEPSKTTLSVLGFNSQNGTFSPFTSGPYGSFVYLRADVAGVSGLGVPTGNVQFLDNGAQLVDSNGQGTWPLNSGGNTATQGGLFTLGVGPHSIKAAYGGDPSFNQSTSTAASLAISQAATNTTVQVTGSDSNGTLIVATVNTASGGNSPTGSVTFFSGGSALSGPSQLTGGVSSTNGTAQATAFISSPISGNVSLSATYTGDTDYLGSTSPALPVSPDFVLWSNAGAGIVFNTRGQTSSSGLYVYGTDSFNGTVTFSCAGLPSESTCSFSPTSLKITPAASVVNTNITIKTTAPTGGMLSPNRARPGLWWTATNGMIFAGFLLVIKPRRARRRLSRLGVLAFLFTLAGCGGGGSGGGGGGGGNAGTPVGDYKIRMTVTGGGITHTASFDLIVQ